MIRKHRPHGSAKICEGHEPPNLKFRGQNTPITHPFRCSGSGCPSILLAQALLMPHKHNAARRHRIPKMSFKVQNWPAYEAGLRQRGSLTL